MKRQRERKRSVSQAHKPQKERRGKEKKSKEKERKKAVRRKEGRLSLCFVETKRNRSFQLHRSQKTIAIPHPRCLSTVTISQLRGTTNDQQLLQRTTRKKKKC
jgi:hypothetical protein